MENNWISVEEKLPYENEAVLITNGKGWYSIGSVVYVGGWFWSEKSPYGSIYEDNGVFVVEGDIDDLDVKYWHELPKPMEI
jgi:hypothetical protein